VANEKPILISKEMYKKLQAIDTTSFNLCRMLGTSRQLEPDQKIKIAESILELMINRKTIVDQVMVEAAEQVETPSGSLYDLFFPKTLKP